MLICHLSVNLGHFTKKIGNKLLHSIIGSFHFFVYISTVAGSLDANNECSEDNKKCRFAFDICWFICRSMSDINVLQGHRHGTFIAIYPSRSEEGEKQ